MHVEGTVYRQMYQPLFCTCHLHPSLCLLSYSKKAEQYEHQKYPIWWKSNLCPFLSHCICSEQNVGSTNCAENYWKEATHLSRRSQFLHHPMVSLLSTSRIFTLSHRKARPNKSPLLLLRHVTFTCTLLMNVIASSLENHAQKFD